MLWLRSVINPFNLACIMQGGKQFDATAARKWGLRCGGSSRFVVALGEVMFGGRPDV